MGYTTFTKKLVQSVLDKAEVKYIIDLGSCNDYDIGGSNPPFISDWYKSKGIEYSCIDLAGDNDALEFDLSQPIELIELADLIVDAGTSEHVVQMSGYESTAFHEGYINSIYPTEVKDAALGYYNCWLNKFNFCKVGGYIVSENPKTGHWKDHGYTYIDKSFYENLISISDLEIVDIGEHGAMGNWETGVNVYSVLKKTGESFPPFELFKTLPLKQS